MDHGYAFPAVAEVVPSESWVLEVAPFGAGVAFRLEAVVTEHHPEYRAARAGEVHSYQMGWLRVSSDYGVESTLSGAPAARDATGALDWGHIDSFDAVGGDWWEL